MLDSRRIKHKGLKRLAAKGDESKLNPEWIPKLKRLLNALDEAVDPTELNTPGNKWHRMKGDREGQYSVWVTGNWRLTFRWDQAGPSDVDLEDYHG